MTVYAKTISFCGYPKIDAEGYEIPCLIEPKETLIKVKLFSLTNTMNKFINNDKL